MQPRNPPAAVDALLYTLGVADPHARLCVTPNSPLWRAWLGAHDTTAHEIFSTRLDVFGARCSRDTAKYSRDIAEIKPTASPSGARRRRGAARLEPSLTLLGAHRRRPPPLLRTPRALRHRQRREGASRGVWRPSRRAAGGRVVGPAGFSCGARGERGGGARFAVSPSSVRIAASINMTRPQAWMNSLHTPRGRAELAQRCA